MEKDLSMWKKEELEVVYLNHHHIKKMGNKPELLRHVKDHMQLKSNEYKTVLDFESLVREELYIGLWGCGHRD